MTIINLTFLRLLSLLTTTGRSQPLGPIPQLQKSTLKEPLRNIAWHTPPNWLIPTAGQPVSKRLMLSLVIVNLREPESLPQSLRNTQPSFATQCGIDVGSIDPTSEADPQKHHSFPRKYVLISIDQWIPTWQSSSLLLVSKWCPMHAIQTPHRSKYHWIVCDIPCRFSFLSLSLSLWCGHIFQPPLQRHMVPGILNNDTFFLN